MTEQHRNVIPCGRQYVELPCELIGVVGNVELGKEDASWRGWDETGFHIIQEDRTKSRGINDAFCRERGIPLIVGIILQESDHGGIRTTIDGVRKVSTELGWRVSRRQRADAG